jgi:DNA primase
MGLTELKKELTKLDKDELIEIVTDLYKKNKSVKEYFEFYVNPNETELFKKYRTKVIEAFFPQHGFNCNLKEGKKAIADFKKLGASPESIADLMLIYAENGVQYTNDYGDIYESFYNSVTSVYRNALMLMKKENLLDKFKDRVMKIVHDTDGIGWNFHDDISDIYGEYYMADKPSGNAG